MVEFLTTNNYIFLSYMKLSFKKNSLGKQSEQINQFFITSNCINVFNIKSTQSKTLKKNNTLIELSIDKLLRKVPNKIRSQVKDLMTLKYTNAFGKSVNQCFTYFY